MDKAQTSLVGQTEFNNLNAILQESLLEQLRQLGWSRQTRPKVVLVRVVRWTIVE